MSWIFFAFGGVLSEAAKTLVDKLTAVYHREKISPLITSFWRNFFFLFFTITIGISGIFGDLYFFFSWVFIPLAIIHIFVSTNYHYFLEHSEIEISRWKSLLYIFPLVYLVIEFIFFDESFSYKVIIGILFLSLGGLIISLRGLSHTKKFIFTKLDIARLLFNFAETMIWWFLFRYLTETEGISPVSFWANAWLWCVVAFLIFILLRGQIRQCLSSLKRPYLIIGTATGQVLGSTKIILLSQAVVLVSIAQTTAIESFSPLIVFIFASMLSFFGIKIEEDFSKDSFFQKLIGVSFICIGGIILAINGIY